MHRTSVIIIILLSVFCVGCKKTHCPAFPANLNYFPYSNGQELHFTNSQNDISSFVISDKKNSKESSYEWNCACECVAHSGFKTNMNQDSLIIDCYLFIIGNFASSVFIDCNFTYIYHYSDNLSENLMVEQQIPYEDLAKHLNDTISIEKENSKIVKKTVIVKNKGLISYTTADGEEWKLLE